MRGEVKGKEVCFVFFFVRQKLHILKPECVDGYNLKLARWMGMVSQFLEGTERD